MCFCDWGNETSRGGGKRQREKGTEREREREREHGKYCVTASDSGVHNPNR